MEWWISGLDTIPTWKVLLVLYHMSLPSPGLAKMSSHQQKQQQQIPPQCQEKCPPKCVEQSQAPKGQAKCPVKSIPQQQQQQQCPKQK
ncbi:hypothetical protein Q9966_004601 [Columba livia]|nr:hypothetical protein Q9966_004601 [Columba livia]